MDSATATWLRSAASLWLFFLHVTNAIRIDKSDGGYIDVRVSIHKAVPYNETIIENIKTLMRDSSGFLHRATHGSLHIKQVIIEIPSTWPRRPYATVRQGSGFEGSDVRVYASSDPNVESRPYTIQPRACGEPGDYIHLSSKFLEELNDHTTKEYGNPSYVFIHEWAHLRYGVFDEHGFLGSEKYPALYCDSEGKVRANVCSDKIAFTARTPSGEDCSVCKNNAVPQNCTVEFHQPAGDLVESSIMFMPYVDNVSEFCVGDNSEKNRHNAFAPNMQNDLCGSKSAWEVISGNDDFEWFPFAELGKFNDVEFQEVQQSNDVVPSMVYVLDVSTSMGGSRLNFVKEVAARRVNDLNDGSLNLGIVTFSTSASTKQEMSLVNDITKNHSLDAIDKLYASGYTCIGCGLLEALNVLKQANVSSKGATVMLMSDGNENQHPRIADVLGNMTSTGVVVNTLAVGADADYGLEKLAHDTGGIAFSFKDPDGTFFPEVDAIFAVSTTAQLDEAERPVMIMNAQVSFGGALKITFHLDEELGNGTVVYVVRERKGTATTNASLIDPAHAVCHKCHSYSSKGTGETKINIPSPAMPGNWTLVLSGPSGEVVRASIRVESRMRDSSVEPVRLKCTVSRLVRSPKQARIYAHVTKGVAIVLDANVEAEVLTPTKTHAVPVQLYDDGLGADNAADDGIYSGTFVNFDGPGRYSVTARATSSELTRLEYISRNSSTLPFSSAKEYQLGSAEYTTPNPRRSARSRRSAPLLQVERFAVGGSFQVTTELNEMSVPPGNIRDLRVIDSSRLCNGTLSVRLSWTWPGGHLDTGTVESVQLRTSASYTSLLNAFEDQNLLTEANVLHGDLLPRPPRTSHRVEVALPAPIVEIHEGKDQTRKVYLSAVVVNEFGLMSDMSSVVVVSSAWNEQELSSQNESPFLLNKILLGLAIAGFATALVSFIALAIWCKRKQGSRNPEPKKHNCDQEC